MMISPTLRIHIAAIDDHRRLYSVFLSFIFIVLSSFGCAQPMYPISISKVQYEKLPPKSSNFPISVIGRTEISRTYKIVAVVQANSNNHSSKEVIEKLKDEARNLGGDALIDLQRGDTATKLPSSSEELPTPFLFDSPRDRQDFYISHKEFWSAKVIVWQNP